MTPNPTELERWSKLAEKYRGATYWPRYYARLFEGVEFADKALVDVGGGVGLASTYALLHGARHATLLEPEAAGSRSTVVERAHALRDDMNFQDRETIITETLQNFSGEGAPFDIAVLEASINHLNEDEVENLHVSEASRVRYRAIIDKLSSMLRPGATIVISDCARRNFFGDLGLRNPLTPTINWNKHQQPRTWIVLLRSCGYVEPKVRWGIHASLGPLGRVLLGNALAFYFLSSYFILTMRYDPKGRNRVENHP